MTNIYSNNVFIVDLKVTFFILPPLSKTNYFFIQYILITVSLLSTPPRSSHLPTPIQIHSLCVPLEKGRLLRDNKKK